MEMNDLEKKFKRKMIELLTMCDVVKELNFSTELDVVKIVDTFIQSVAGLFLMEKVAIIILDRSCSVYTTGESAGLKDGLEKLKSEWEKIYPQLIEFPTAILVDEVKDESVKKGLREQNIELLVPMSLRKEVRGIFLAGKRLNREPYGEEDRNLLFAFTNQAIVTIENARYFKGLQRHVEELSIFNEIIAAINSDLDISILLDMILGVLLKMLEAHAGFIFVLHENKETLFFVQQNLDEIRKRIVIGGKDTEGMISKILSSSKDKLHYFYPKEAAVQEKDLFTDSDNNVYFWISRSLFVRRENIIGIVSLAKKMGEVLSEEDVNLFLTFTSQLIMIVLNARLYELSITDGLTNLFVHTYFEQRLREEISRARRYSSTVSVILMDIDHFKDLNDNLGHLKGNIVLRRLASIISLSVRKNEDIPCRWGGDEFAIILPETGREGAYVLAERIRRNIESFSFPYDEKSNGITISAGIASFPGDAIEEKGLIEKADVLLYQAKKAGGNKVVQYPL